MRALQRRGSVSIATCKRQKHEQCKTMNVRKRRRSVFFSLTNHGVIFALFFVGCISMLQCNLECSSTVECISSQSLQCELYAKGVKE